VALAVFLAKLCLGLSNSVLACLFQIKCMRTVSRICHQIRTALIKDFVPKHLGFQHMDRNTVLGQHQSVIATDLLTDSPNQVVLIADGTYIYCEKSSNNEFQRRTYSSHKHRHLVKPMIITTSVSIVKNSRSKMRVDWTTISSTRELHVIKSVFTKPLLTFIATKKRFFPRTYDQTFCDETNSSSMERKNDR
jgi:hypothetical protein